MTLNWRKYLYYKIKLTGYYINIYWPIAFIGFLVIFVLVLTFSGITQHEEGPWYLGCADRNGKELLLQTNSKPRIEGGLIFIEDDVFVIPEPGMTCRRVTVRKIEAEQSINLLDRTD